MITINDIRDKDPCYDPTKYLPEDWTGTMVDILKVEDCPAEDRIWVASVLLDDRTLRLFAVTCARRALELVGNPDPRSVEACNVAERFANGGATQEELDTAAAAAWAARAAAYTAAADAARCDAAWAAWAVWGGADAAYAAAKAAADTAARVARAAARAAAYAAAYAAARAERQWQVETLIKLCEGLT